MFRSVIFLLSVFLISFSLEPLQASGKSKKTEETVWVKRQDGSVSCENDPKKAQSPEAAARELDSAGVKILEQKKQHDGKMRAAVCGIATGNENAFLIKKDDLKKAMEKGFIPEQQPSLSKGAKK